MHYQEKTGILKRATDAKEKSEIEKEKENIVLALNRAEIQAISESKNVNSKMFKEGLDDFFGQDKTTLNTTTTNKWLVTVLESERKYEVDKKNYEIGKIEDGVEVEITIDEEPGILEIIEENHFQINSVEDLVAFAYNVNSGKNLYENSIIELGRSLNIEDDKSYVNPQTKYVNDNNYGYIISEEGTSLKELVENDFIGIGISQDHCFKGKEFRGNDYTIEKIKILGDEFKTYGFFAYVKSADIRISNLILDSTYELTGGGSAGGLIGCSYAKTLIVNCKISGKASGTAEKKVSSFGGIIGYSGDDTTIINSISGSMVNNIQEYEGNAPSSGSSVYKERYINIIGGLVDTFYNENATLMIRNCINFLNLECKSRGGGALATLISGKIDIDGFRNVGTCYYNTPGELAGVIGTIENITGDSVMKNCESREYKDWHGELRGRYTGGIIGLIRNSRYVKLTLENCKNYMDLGIQTSDGTGGIMYLNSSPIYLEMNKCYNFGAVNASVIGAGIITYAAGSSSITIKNCYNAGNILSYRSGGILCIAKQQTYIYNSCNVGQIGREGGTIGAGILAMNESNPSITIQNAFNQGVISTASSRAEITGLTVSSISNCYYEEEVNTGITTTNATAVGTNIYSIINNLNSSCNSSNGWAFWRVEDNSYMKHGWRVMF